MEFPSSDRRSLLGGEDNPFQFTQPALTSPPAVQSRQPYRRQPSSSPANDIHYHSTPSFEDAEDDEDGSIERSESNATEIGLGIGNSGPVQSVNRNSIQRVPVGSKSGVRSSSASIVSPILSSAASPPNTRSIHEQQSFYREVPYDNGTPRPEYGRASSTSSSPFEPYKHTPDTDRLDPRSAGSYPQPYHNRYSGYTEEGVSPSP